MCDDPKEGGAARGVSRVGYVGAHARFVRRAVRYRSESRRFCRGVRRSIARAFSALPDGRRVVVAVPPPAWKWGVAVGVRWAVAMAMAVAGFAVRLGGIVHAGIARALTSAHRSAMSGGGHDTSARRRFTARDSSTTRHSSLRSNTGSTATVTHSPVPHALQAQHRTESLEPSEAALGKGSSRQTADTPGWFLTFGSGRASLGTLAVRVALPSYSPQVFRSPIESVSDVEPRMLQRGLCSRARLRVKGEQPAKELLALGAEGTPLAQRHFMRFLLEAFVTQRPRGL